jgi:nitroimidazol reductase NimA-like FMN-containing flavoprotein (pyridoxamine 5'-phosphate oxidase superfamily)
MNKRQETFDNLKEFFGRRYLGVLATQDRVQPYTSLVACATTDDPKQILFTTNRATRKFANLSADGRASILVDDSSNRRDDIAEAMAVTATGTAVVVSEAQRGEPAARFLAQHPAGS